MCVTDRMHIKVICKVWKACNLKKGLFIDNANKCIDHACIVHTYCLIPIVNIFIYLCISELDLYIIYCSYMYIWHWIWSNLTKIGLDPRIQIVGSVCIGSGSTFLWHQICPLLNSLFLPLQRGFSGFDDTWLKVCDFIQLLTYFVRIIDQTLHKNEMLSSH